MPDSCPPALQLRAARPADDAQLDALAREVGLSLHAEKERGLPQARLLVAEWQGELCALALGWIVADELEVVDVAVAEAFRRRGVAQALVAQLLAEARERGCREAFLEVRAGNVPAQRLYQALGFERVGERAGYYGDGEDAFLFRCCVAAQG